MNALRTLGKAGALAVLLLDALKGFAPTLLGTLRSFADRLDMEGLPPSARDHRRARSHRRGARPLFFAVAAISAAVRASRPRSERSLRSAGRPGWSRSAAGSPERRSPAIRRSARCSAARWRRLRSGSSPARSPRRSTAFFAACLILVNASRKHSPATRRNRKPDSPLATARNRAPGRAMRARTVGNP